MGFPILCLEFLSSTCIPPLYFQLLCIYVLVYLLQITPVKFTFKKETVSSLQFSRSAQSCPTLCDPMNHSMPGLPVHHQLPEFTQTHVHRVGAELYRMCVCGSSPFTRKQLAPKDRWALYLFLENTNILYFLVMDISQMFQSPFMNTLLNDVHPSSGQIQLLLLSTGVGVHEACHWR